MIARALGMLTILPVPRWATSSPAAGGAVVMFPLVGAALGAVVALVDLAMSGRSPSVAAAIDLAVLAALTGALHLDGLADSADGLGAGPDVTARLAAMRDPHIGVFGTVAVVLVLLIEYAALSSLAGTARAGALIGGLVLSRWTMSVAPRLRRPARADGLGAAVSRGTRGVDVVFATLIAVPLVLAHPAPLVAIGATIACLALVLGIARRAFGGATGDVYGAAGELAFAACLVAAAV